MRGSPWVGLASIGEVGYKVPYCTVGGTETDSSRKAWQKMWCARFLHAVRSWSCWNSAGDSLSHVKSCSGLVGASLVVAVAGSWPLLFTPFLGLLTAAKVPEAEAEAAPLSPPLLLAEGAPMAASAAAGTLGGCWPPRSGEATVVMAAVKSVAPVLDLVFCLPLDVGDVHFSCSAPLSVCPLISQVDPGRGREGAAKSAESARNSRREVIKVGWGVGQEGDEVGAQGYEEYDCMTVTASRSPRLRTHTVCVCVCTSISVCSNRSFLLVHVLQIRYASQVWSATKDICGLTAETHVLQQSYL